MFWLLAGPPAGTRTASRREQRSGQPEQLPHFKETEFGVVAQLLVVVQGGIDAAPALGVADTELDGTRHRVPDEQHP